MKIDNIPNLKIYKLTKEQYRRRLENGEIEENAFYFTPGASDGGSAPVIVTIDYNSKKASHTGPEIYNLVQEGKTVVGLLNDSDEIYEYFSLQRANELSSTFSYTTDDGLQTLYCIWDNGSVSCYEYQFYNENSVQDMIAQAISGAIGGSY